MSGPDDIVPRGREDSPVFRLRSIRAYSRPATPDEIEHVLRAARRAPTAAMMHGYSVIVVADPALRRSLDACGGNQKALRNSSLLLFCVDLRRARRWGELLRAPVTYSGFTGLLFGAVDCTLAAANAIHAAMAIGLGTCVIGTFFHRAHEVCEVLDLPEGVLPLFGLALGLPAEDPTLRPRLPLTSLAHENRYRDADAGETRTAWQDISTWSAGEAEAERTVAETEAWIRALVAGRWWVTGEEQLLKALARQGLLPADPAR